MPKFNLSWVYVILIAALIYMIYSNKGGSIYKEVDYTTFKTYIAKGYAKKLIVNKGDGTARIEINPSFIKNVFNKSIKETGNAPTVVTDYPTVDKVEEFINTQIKAGKFKGTVSYEQKSDYWWSLFINFAPFILLIVFWLYMMRRSMGGNSNGGGMFSVGKNKATLFEKGNGAHVTFKDVAGQEGAKQEVKEIVYFLKNPQRYTELGGKIPKGALLVGPPGTGKTLLAKAVAGEADVPFFSISGSDFVEMFVGVGASRVRDLFRQAKEKSPCIIFIDEIDAVGRARGKNPSMGGNDERENTLNQLLTEMDGFGTNSGVIVLAATNRVDILDKALLRAGRFDRQIYIDLPDLNERKAIFAVHMRPLKMDKSVDTDLLARQTPGFSGADIANVCNEAALTAARKDKQFISMQDFLDATDRIIGGLEKKTKVMTESEKRSIALHEAGHATISWFLRYANPLVKVTIVPRGRALGAAWYLPEERVITTKEELQDEICATLGGRAAEELFTGKISSGALNDLETVTQRAYGMVAYLGMSDKLYNICYYSSTQDYSFSKPYSEKTAETIDAEVKQLIEEQYERAKNILQEHKDGHNRLAQVLVEREVIFAADVEEIFGKRPWPSRADEILAESEGKKQEEKALPDKEDESQSKGDALTKSLESEIPEKTSPANPEGLSEENSEKAEEKKSDSKAEE